MGLAILFRKRAQINMFRNILIGSIDLGIANKSTICSGFFQELFKNTYKASEELNFSTVLVNHSVELTTIGIHNNVWLPSYKNFRNNLRAAGVNIRAMYTSSYHWHAKIFILKQIDNPILAIIGSSNITRNAFSITQPFNYEADVLMWLDDINPLTSFINNTIAETRDDPHEIIIADYDISKNNDLTIEERIKRIDTELKELKLKDLPE